MDEVVRRYFEYANQRIANGRRAARPATAWRWAMEDIEGGWTFIG